MTDVSRRKMRMEKQSNARVQRSVAAQWGLQQCERHRSGCSRAERPKDGCNNARGTEVLATVQRQQREHRIAAEVASASGGFRIDKDVSSWVDQLLTSR